MIRTGGLGLPPQAPWPAHHEPSGRRGSRQQCSREQPVWQRQVVKPAQDTVGSDMWCLEADAMPKAHVIGRRFE